MRTKQIKTVYIIQKKKYTNKNSKQKTHRKPNKIHNVISRSLFPPRSMSGRNAYTYIYRSFLDRAAKYDIHMKFFLQNWKQKKKNTIE